MNVKYSLTKIPTTAAEKQKKADGKRWRGIWYVRWRRPDGSYSSAKSTGCETKKDARTWCDDRLDDARLSPDVLLSTYADGFFAWPDGRYAIDRSAGGHRVSYRSAQSHRLDYQNHINRILGDPKLRQITKTDTKRLRDELYREGKAAATINHIVNTLSTILQAAEDDDIIAAIPRLYRAGGKGKPRGSLTVDEARELFSKGNWRDERERIASLLAAATGLRQSEILGLTRDRVHRDHLDVSQVWDNNAYRLKDSTKSGDSRVVPVSKMIRRELARLILAAPRRGFVFYHDTREAAPYPGHQLTEGLYHALRSIGMSNEARKDARITFHSWRHFANSLYVESGLSETTVRAMIGHQSADMTMNYYHAQDVERIVGIQESITAGLRMVR